MFSYLWKEGKLISPVQRYKGGRNWTWAQRTRKSRTGQEEGKSHGEQKPREIRTNKRCRGKLWEQQRWVYKQSLSIVFSIQTQKLKQQADAYRLHVCAKPHMESTSTLQMPACSHSYHKKHTVSLLRCHGSKYTILIVCSTRLFFISCFLTENMAVIKFTFTVRDRGRLIYLWKWFQLKVATLTGVDTQI